MILVSSCPAFPTNGSPCKSSSSPGASPTNISSASGLPTPKTTCVRVAARCGHRVQTKRGTAHRGQLLRFARSSGTGMGAKSIDAGGTGKGATARAADSILKAGRGSATAGFSASAGTARMCARRASAPRSARNSTPLSRSSLSVLWTSSRACEKDMVGTLEIPMGHSVLSTLNFQLATTAPASTKSAGIGDSKFTRSPVRGCDEAELPGVQHLARKAGAFPVDVVAEQRMAEVLQMHANLVRAAGVQRAFDERRAAISRRTR